MMVELLTTIKTCPIVQSWGMQVDGKGK